MTIIFHIASRSAWAAAQAAGLYRDPSLESEGFIHCSSATQVLRVADMLFHGRDDLLLLCIDRRRLGSPLRYEAPAEDPASAERFPHIYGPLNLDAIVETLLFTPGDDGRFRLPVRAQELADGAGGVGPALADQL